MFPDATDRNRCEVILRNTSSRLELTHRIWIKCNKSRSECVPCPQSYLHRLLAIGYLKREQCDADALLGLQAVHPWQLPTMHGLQRRDFTRNFTGNFIEHRHQRTKTIEIFVLITPFWCWKLIKIIKNEPKKLHSECVRVAVVSLLNPDSPASFMGYISLLQAAVTFLAKEEHR